MIRAGERRHKKSGGASDSVALRSMRPNTRTLQRFLERHLAAVAKKCGVVVTPVLAEDQLSQLNRVTNASRSTLLGRHLRRSHLGLNIKVGVTTFKNKSIIRQPATVGQHVEARRPGTACSAVHRGGLYQ